MSWQATPLLVGRAQPKPLVGYFVRRRSLLAGLRGPEPGARPSELHQPVRVEVRSTPNEQVIVECIDRGAWKQPGSFIIAGWHRTGGRPVKWGQSIFPASDFLSRL